jgi:hypothetical protein
MREIDIETPAGLPDAREIAEACRRIRETWSEDEHRARAGLPYGPYREHWTPPQLSGRTCDDQR